jgi:Txe/YoeB family toxin of Txe-Axe toxin-antitoxin module
MDKKLELQIVEKYPTFFEEYGGDPRETCLAWGFECGDGWYDLINNLCRDLTKVTENKDYKIVVLQVKEKFGGLRFYFAVEHQESDFLFRIGSMFRKFMFNKRLGRQYHKMVDLRKRFYKTTYEKINDLVEKAETDSYKICETCGKPGDVMGKGWVRVSCKECFEIK